MRCMTRDRPRRFVVAVLLAASGVLGLGPGAQAAAGDAVWTDHADLDGAWDFGFRGDADGGLVFAVGVGNVRSGDAAGMIRAYEPRTGTLVWSDRVDTEGEDDFTRELEAHRGRVFVAGWSGDCRSKASDCDLLVLAYDARTGERLWSDRFDLGGGVNGARGIVASGDTVFVVGGGETAPGRDFDALIRAYEASTGALLWSDALHLLEDDQFFDVAVAGSRVFASGHAEGRALVRAYDARTGEGLWTELFRIATSFDRFPHIAARGDVVVAAGSGRRHSSPVTDDDRILRAFDARTGRSLWDRQFASGNRNSYSGLDAIGNRLFASGTTGSCGDAWGPGEDCDFVVQALDIRTGALHWEDRVDAGGPFDSAHSVTASGDRVYAVGTSGADCASFGDAGCDGLIRAYEARTGALVWSDLFDRAGGLDRFWDVAPSADGVVVAGVSSSEATDDPAKRDFLVGTYDAR